MVVQCADVVVHDVVKRAGFDDFNEPAQILGFGIENRGITANHSAAFDSDFRNRAALHNGGRTTLLVVVFGQCRKTVNHVQFGNPFVVGGFVFVVVVNSNQCGGVVLRSGNGETGIGDQFTRCFNLDDAAVREPGGCIPSNEIANEQFTGGGA